MIKHLTFQYRFSPVPAHIRLAPLVPPDPQDPPYHLLSCRYFFFSLPLSLLHLDLHLRLKPPLLKLSETIRFLRAEGLVKQQAPVGTTMRPGSGFVLLEDKEEEDEEKGEEHW